MGYVLPVASELKHLYMCTNDRDIPHEISRISEIYSLEQMIFTSIKMSINICPEYMP